MKLRTWAALGLGYFVGARLKPDQLQDLVQNLGQHNPLSSPETAKPAVEWPDPKLKL